MPQTHGSLELDSTTTYQDLGNPRYLTITNTDPKRPNVFITSREHSAFLGDLTLVLTLRRPSAAESRALAASKHRQELRDEQVKHER